MTRTSRWPALVAACLLAAGCGAGTAVPLSARVEDAGETSSSSAPSGVTSTGEESVVVRTEKVTRATKFKTVTRRDPDLDKGETRVVRPGVRGVLELTFRVTYTDGKRTGRRLTGTKVLRAPVNRVVAVGTRVEPVAGGDCDPNYTGACVPVDSDVDCAGGSGNGPSYVAGPVRVVGDDVYDLDRDGDGLACE